MLVLACVVLTSARSVTAQEITLGFGGPSGPLPWSEQGFDVAGGGFGVWSTGLTSGKLSISAFGSGFGYADVIVSRADGGRFNAHSLDIVSVTGSVFDVAIWSSKTGPDWVRGPSGVGTDVLTGPDFEAIEYLAISAWPPSDTSVTVLVDNLVVEPVVWPWTDLGSALVGAGGAPILLGTGTLASGSANAIDLFVAAPDALAALFIAPGSAPVPFKGGTLVPFPFLDPVILQTSLFGAIELPFVMPAGVPAGTEVWAQWAIADAGAVHGVALSNAIVAVTP